MESKYSQKYKKRNRNTWIFGSTAFVSGLTGIVVAALLNSPEILAGSALVTGTSGGIAIGNHIDGTYERSKMAVEKVLMDYGLIK